jgi:adenylate cyclase
MRRNVEIKARVSTFDSIVEKVEAFADDGPTIIEQEDTFFNCPRGRLKLRKFSESEGELIFYNRPDTLEPKECQYIISPTPSPGSLRDVLSHSLGIKGLVRKQRTLYLVGQTRIHLDEVEGLGKFIEIEVVLHPEQNTADGVRIANDLIEKLGIHVSDLVDRAYIDILLERAVE